MYIITSLPGIKSKEASPEKVFSKKTLAKVVEATALLFFFLGVAAVGANFIPGVPTNVLLYAGGSAVLLSSFTLLTTLVIYLVNKKLHKAGSTHSHKQVIEEENSSGDGEFSISSTQSDEVKKKTEVNSPKMYDNMYTNAKDVAAAMKAQANSGEWINFCNPLFVENQEEGEDRECLWKLHITIDPTKLQKAWEIIGPIIMNAKSEYDHDLALHGKIQTDFKGNNSQPGKQIMLQVLKEEQDKESDWRLLFQEITDTLMTAGIDIDPRPINSDKEQAKRKWDRTIKTGYADDKGCTDRFYFNYRSDAYTVIDDENWDDFTAGYTMEAGGSIARANKGDGAMVKRSYYNNLDESEKHNPLRLNDPFKDMIFLPEEDWQSSDDDSEAESD